MRYEFQDLNGQRWQVALSSSEAGLAIDSLARGDENIVSHLSAKVGAQQVSLSDGSRAKLCKVGDDWWVHHQGRTHRVTILEAGTDDSQISDGSLVAPMPGTILDIMVEKNTKSARKENTVPMPISMISKPARTRSDKLSPH